MKNTMIALALLVGGYAQAAGSKYICKEITEDSTQFVRTVILTQVSNRGIKEGVKEAFTLEMYETGDKTALMIKKGSVQTEDVMFTFKSNDKSVAFNIYLDELDQGSLTLKGKRDATFDCN